MVRLQVGALKKAALLRLRSRFFKRGASGGPKALSGSASAKIGNFNGKKRARKRALDFPLFALAKRKRGALAGN